MDVVTVTTNHHFQKWVNPFHIKKYQFSLILWAIGADSTGATGNFAPVLTQESGQTLRFAAVPFMAVL